jgi:hypothetical protein
MTAKWVGVTPTSVLRASCISFHSMLQKPETALTGRPSDLRLSGRDGVEGAEDVARAVDEEEMIAFFHVGMDNARAVKRP